MKSHDKIFSCSHTLELLVSQYKKFHEENEVLVDRVSELEDENFRIKKELGDRRVVT